MTPGDMIVDSEFLRFDATIDRFEVAWQSGVPPRIADFLPSPDDKQRRELLLELIKVDIEYRWSKGMRPVVEDYVAEFPELTAASPLPLDLVVEEMRVREYHDELPTSAELEQRFPGVTFDTLQICAREKADTSLAFRRRTTRSRSNRASDNSYRTGVRNEAKGGEAKGDAAVTAGARLGRYELREQLGRGGFATVYRAYDSELHREVAIKVPRAELLDDDEAAGRIMREAHSAARLRHPAIVPIYEVGREGEQPYIVYEYVPGPTLSALIRDTRPAPEQAAQWLATVAEALDYAHHCGIVHRDVKPANIIMAPTPGPSAGQPDYGLTPMLADFGLALRAGAGVTVTQQGDILGTPAYMSPEQAAGRGHDVDASTDVYSLGVILYELLCGQLPFQGSGVSVLHRVIHEDPSPPGRFRRDLPADLETICLKAMAKDPKHRYRTAASFAEDLRRYLEHKPIRARRTSLVGRLVLWSRRKPALAATMVLATMVSLSVATVSFWRVVQERDRYRAERDRAEANLYRALYSDANAQIRARDTAWWWTAMDNIRQAAQLDVTVRNPVQLRELAIQCMGTQFPCMRLRSEWPGHDGAITSVAFSPNGQIIASGSRDKILRIRTQPSGRTLATLSNHEQIITGLAFHPSGESVAATYEDGVVRMWDLKPLLDATRVEGIQSELPYREIDLGASAVRRVAFSPDGKWLAGGCVDGAVRLASLHGPPEIRDFKGHSEQVMDLEFSGDGILLASCSRDRTIRVWDVNSGKTRATWSRNNTPIALASFLYNTQLAWAESENFGIFSRDLWESTTKSQIQVHTAVVSFIDWDRRGRLLTASHDGTLRIGTLQENGYRELGIARSTFGEVTTGALSSDGKWIAAGYFDGQVRLWELFEPPQRLISVGKYQRAVFLGDSRRITDVFAIHDCSTSMAAFPKSVEPPAIQSIIAEPGGNRFAYCVNDAGLHVGNWNERRQLYSTLAHDRPISSLAASPTGKQFATGSTDGTVKLWSWDSDQSVRSWSVPVGELRQLLWSRDGRELIGCGLSGVATWDPEQPSPPQRLVGVSSTTHLACSQNSIATAEPDGIIVIRRRPSGEPVHRLPHSAGITGMDFSPDGKRLATAALDQTLRIWDAESGSEIHRFPHERWAPTWLKWGPGADDVMTGGSYPRSATIWNAQTGDRYSVGQPSNGFSAQPVGNFPNDGKILLGTDFGSIRLFEMRAADAHQNQQNANVESPRAVPVFEPGAILVPGGHWDRLWGAAASPDGRYFASGAHDQTVKLWDARTLQLIRTLEGHTEIVWCVAFSPDSKFLATGSSNSERGVGEIIIWEVTTGREVQHLEQHQRLVTCVDYHSSGNWLASCALDGSVYLRDLRPNGKATKIFQFDRPVYSAAFRPDGRWLAAGCIDRRVAVWDVDRLIAALKDGSPTADETAAKRERDHAAAIPKETQATSLSQSNIEPSCWLTDHTTSVYSVGWSPRGEYLATGAEQGVIQLWDGNSFRRVVKLQGDTGQIRNVAFSRDGQLLAAASYASSLLVWDLNLVRSTLESMNLNW